MSSTTSHPASASSSLPTATFVPHAASPAVAPHAPPTVSHTVSPTVSAAVPPAVSALATGRAETARQGRVLASVCMASATMPMVFTGAAVALGGIADDLGASAAALAWVTNAFMLTFGGFMLAAGALADRIGRRRVFRAGALLFLIASALLPVAQAMWAFNLLRGLQGLAGAAILSSGAALLAQEFDGPARTRAFSWLGTSFGIGLVLGPISAGFLSTAFGWRAIFVLVMATQAIALFIGAGALRESRDDQVAAFDWPGAALFTTALSALTWAVLHASERGWSDAGVVAGLVASLMLFIVFARIEHRSPAPMLDLSLFRYRRFIGIQLLAAAPAYAFVVLLVMLPIRFAGIEGLSASLTGWLIAALSAPLLVLPLVAGRATRWCSPSTLCGAGLLVAAAGLWWLSRATGGIEALPAMALIGIGISGPWGLMDGLAVSVVPPQRAGMAAGIFSTVRVAGEGVALAIVGSTLSALIAARLPAEMQAAAPLLATGRLGEATAVHAAMSSADVVVAYEQAFSQLAQGLALVTVLTAVVVLFFLRGAAPTVAR